MYKAPDSSKAFTGAGLEILKGMSPFYHSNFSKIKNL